MKPNKIILIRHGESEGNVDRKVYGLKPDYALELTEAGRAQALLAGEKLKTIVGDQTMFFYVSPMWRTRETFEQISRAFNGRKISYLEEPRIREQEWGHLRDLAECERVEKDRDAYGTFYYRIPDGESAADVYDRVSDFFGTLHRDFEHSDFPENAVIVTHGMAIRLFLMKWFHWTVEEFEMLANPANCDIVVLEKNDVGKYELKTEMKKYNSVFHKYQRPLQFRK